MTIMRVFNANVIIIYHICNSTRSIFWGQEIDKNTRLNEQFIEKSDHLTFDYDASNCIDND